MVIEFILIHLHSSFCSLCCYFHFYLLFLGSHESSSSFLVFQLSVHLSGRWICRIWNSHFNTSLRSSRVSFGVVGRMRKGILPTLMRVWWLAGNLSENIKETLGGNYENFVYVAGQRITTIQLDGVQYFVSRMNPYSPELNYFLAYQYCRSLGLQLASFETKEKVESMTQYLQNAGYSKYDFWTSGNRLGTGMFLWMSTGLPFNATFDYFENSSDGVASSLEQVDHNQNTAPQRTARDRLVDPF